MNRSYLRLLRVAVLSGVGLVLLAVFALACSYVYLAPSLPTDENAQPVPLRIYTSSGGLISQIGERRSIPVTYDQIPEVVRQAVLAAEDDRFFEHHGIDWMGVARALVTNVVSAEAGQGGSTITQQAARNMFLTLDKTARRKLSEVFVTYRMERDFTKEQILAIYLNVALFGHRSYGIAAAAETYYGKHLDQLTVAEAATLVGLLPAPSNYNPISKPKNAERRRNYVLGRMTKLGYIDEATAAAAQKEPVATVEHAPLVDVQADYVAEMVRQFVEEMFGAGAVNGGYKVWTTLDGRLQMAANNALRKGLMEYDKRHGYRGKLGKVQLPAGASARDLDALLQKFDSVGILQVAVVTKLADKNAEVRIRGVGNAKIAWEDLKWRPQTKSGGLGAFPQKPSDVVNVGDVIHVISDGRGSAMLAQLPQAQSALVALDPDDGAIVSLVGGFDFHHNKFNRVMQARRQPGSGFKPFIYSAALENGYTAASVIQDLPVVIERGPNDEENWQPENSGGGSSGPMRFREALIASKNQVSIRILQNIGVDAAIDHAAKFGFKKESLPPYLTLALGVQSARPIEMATGYAVFANGGFKVEPYFISRVEDASGKVVYEAKPVIACAECELHRAPGVEEEEETAAAEEAAAPASAETPALEPIVKPELDAATLAEAAAPAPRIRDVEAPPALREIALQQGGLGYLLGKRLAPRVLSAQNAWIMDDIMHDVTVRGTAQRSRVLGRNDLAGKTGTTQSSRDNWFNGFTRNLVASVWVGFDDEKSLGESEEGSKTALPIWIHYMREALRAVPESRLQRPGGLVDLRVSKTTGVLANQQDPGAVYETFMVEHPPRSGDGGDLSSGPAAGGAKSAEPLF